MNFLSEIILQLSDYFGHLRIENRDSFLKQDQMEEKLEKDPGLHIGNA